MYKRFLHEAGVTQEAFEMMTGPEKVETRAIFDKAAKGLNLATGKDMQTSLSMAEATSTQLFVELRGRLESAVLMHPARAALEDEDKEDIDALEAESVAASCGSVARRTYQV